MFCWILLQKFFETRNKREAENQNLQRAIVSFPEPDPTLRRHHAMLQKRARRACLAKTDKADKYENTTH